MLYNVAIMITSNRKETRKATKAKRRSQSCKVYEIKIDKSHLSQTTIYHINKLFQEFKWIYNFFLSQPNINQVDTKLSTVPVKVLDQYEERDLNLGER